MIATCPPCFSAPPESPADAPAGDALAPGPGSVSDPSMVILVVEDELALSRHVVAALRRERHEARAALLDYAKSYLYGVRAREVLGIADFETAARIAATEQSIVEKKL